MAFICGSQRSLSNSERCRSPEARTKRPKMRGDRPQLCSLAIKFLTLSLQSSNVFPLLASRPSPASNLSVGTRRYPMNWLAKMLFGEESEKEAEEIIEIATSDPDGDIWDPQLPTTGGRSGYNFLNLRPLKRTSVEVRVILMLHCGQAAKQHIVGKSLVSPALTKQSALAVLPVIASQAPSGTPFWLPHPA